jgi:hypothetical protein
MPRKGVAIPRKISKRPTKHRQNADTARRAGKLDARQNVDSVRRNKR